MVGKVVVIDQYDRLGRYPTGAMTTCNLLEAQEYLTREAATQAVVVIDTVLQEGIWGKEAPGVIQEFLDTLPESASVYLLLQDDGLPEKQVAFNYRFNRYDLKGKQACQMQRTGRSTFPERLPTILAKPTLEAYVLPQNLEVYSRGISDAYLGAFRTVRERQRPV